jgi:hypothetical protein
VEGPSLRTAFLFLQGILYDLHLFQPYTIATRSLNRRLKELEEAGFIAHMTPYDKARKDTTYRIIDPYVYFFLSWIERAPSGVHGRSVWVGHASHPPGNNPDLIVLTKTNARGRPGPAARRSCSRAPTSWRNSLTPMALSRASFGWLVSDPRQACPASHT